MKNWVTVQNQEHKKPKVTWDEKRAKPEDYGYKAVDVEKKTVPGQALSVKEIMTRYEKGRPIPQE